VTATVTPLRGCTYPGCARPARMAAGPTRAVVGLNPAGEPSTTLGITVEQLFYDWRAAPPSARLVCKAHGLDLVASLVAMYVSDDEEAPLDPEGPPVDPNVRFLTVVREVTS
jgi:hypothetical protein